MNLKKSIFLVLILPVFAFSAHKYYLSMADINYDKKEKSLQIIMNVFMDDIELAVNKKYGVDLQLTSKNELKNADEHFKNYLKDYFKIKVNNKMVAYQYLGKEYDGNIVFFYLEIPEVNSIKTIEVFNQVLVKEFEKQQNIIKVTIGSNKQSKILSKNNDKALLKF